MTPEIDIALSTYNGEEYLPMLLASLNARQDIPLRILVRDDGSDDNTLMILHRFAEQEGDRVCVIPNREGNLRPRAAFSRILQESTAPYLMLCDQDDVWMPGRIEQMYDCIQASEVIHGPQTPVLCHSDLTVVDKDMTVIHDSFWQFQQIDPAAGSHLSRLLAGSIVTGCATIMNRALLERALPIPQEAIMHDWWLALVAGVYGAVEYIPQSTIWYRQHGANQVGAQSGSGRGMLRRIKQSLSGEVSWSRLPDLIRQAKALVAHLQAQGAEVPEQLQAFATLTDCNAITKRLRMMRHGFWRSGWWRNAALFLFS